MPVSNKAKAFYERFQKEHIYMTCSRVTPWAVGEARTLKDGDDIFAKKVLPFEVSYVIGPYKVWSENGVYEEGDLVFSDTQEVIWRLKSKGFGAGGVEPRYTILDEVMTSDGCVWEYVQTVDLDSLAVFFDSNWLPVTPEVANKMNATNVAVSLTFQPEDVDYAVRFYGTRLVSMNTEGERFLPRMNDCYTGVDPEFRSGERLTWNGGSGTFVRWTEKDQMGLINVEGNLPSDQLVTSESGKTVHVMMPSSPKQYTIEVLASSPMEHGDVVGLESVWNLPVFNLKD